MISEFNNALASEVVEQYPLSFAQERLWFLEQLNPGQSTYNIPLLVRLRGDLNRGLLEDSIRVIIARHDTLRTRFVVRDGIPSQIIDDEGEFRLTYTDLHGLPLEQMQQELDDWLRREAEFPFDLSRGPLSRWHLLRVGQEEFVLIANLHHIIADGWSLGVLVKEVSGAYTSLVRNGVTDLEELPIQYVDYAVWQKQWVEGGGLEEQRAYWREQLADLSMLDLPTDRPRSAVQEHRGGKVPLNLEESLWRELRKWCQERGVTPFTLFVATMQILLSRLTGQTDIAIGTAIANRTRAEFEPLIGCFANTLVLRGDLGGDPRLTDHIGKTQEMLLQAYANQDIPFEQVVKDLAPERHLERMPLVQVVLVLQNAPLPDLRLPGLEVSVGGVGTETSKFDCVWNLRETAGHIEGGIEYDADLFEESSIAQMVEWWKRLLRNALSNGDARLSTLQMLDATEINELLENRLVPESTERTSRSLADMFEDQVCRIPDAIALSAEEQDFSYGYLNRRANALAHALRARGAGPEVRVGLSTERTVWTVIGMLAIAKAGAAYVPLDPTYSLERLRLMMTEANVSLVLKQSELRVFDELGVVGINIADIEVKDVLGSEENISRSGDGQNLCYIIFTSGSTGVPKGSMITQSSVARLFDVTGGLFDFGVDDVWTVFHSWSFDFSVWELWGPLTSGGRAVIVPSSARTSADELHDLLLSRQVTILNQTPSSFLRLVNSDRFSEQRAGALQHVILGGEALALEDLRSWFDRYGDAHPHVTNMYGITETTVHVTFRRLRETDLDGDARSPIGRPLGDLGLFVVDEQFGLAPRKTIGEIFVEGEGLARGYLNRPDLTAERFLPNPYSLIPGARWYRTGDTARYLEQGELVYVGRRDRQVKMRGYRIELGEIESVVNQCPGIKSCSVVVHHSSDGDDRLAVYLVPEVAEGEDARTASGVEQWQQVFDEIYRRTSPGGDKEFNTTGWDSSYTNQPIPGEEMREWVDATVSRILRLRPSRILEIGCGTGLIAKQILPRCDVYCGTDFSETALAALKSSITGLEDEDRHRLVLAPADNLSDIGEESYDTVVLNSIVQYFPDGGYFDRVLKGAVQRAAHAGRIFLGDLRGANWLEAFHLSVVVTQSGAAASTEEIGRSLLRSLAYERELLVSPQQLFNYAARNPRISGIDILLKRGSARNEMTRFRYDTVLYLDVPPAAVAPDAIVEWGNDVTSKSALREHIGSSRADTLLVRNIGNSRVAREMLAASGLKSRLDAAQVDFRTFWDDCRSDDDLDPEEACALGEAVGYHVVPYLSGTDANRFHLWLQRGKEAVSVQPEFLGWTVRETAPSAEVASASNLALAQEKYASLVAAVRTHVRSTLPVYMVPSLWMTIKEIPLTVNGKLDRKSLPDPETGNSWLEVDGQFRGPTTETEALLAGIWAEVLHLGRVGINQDFFRDLGGHSLMATQVVSRIRESARIDLPLRIFFDNPTVAGLSTHVDLALKRKAGISQVSIPGVDEGMGEFPLSFSQERLWFLEQMGLPAGTYHISIGIRLRGILSIDALNWALQKLAERHEVLRTRFEMKAGVPVQTVVPAGGVDLAMFDYSDSLDTEREGSCAATLRGERERPFRLERGETWRSAIVRLGPEEHVLSLVLHHIVADGWSLGIMAEEIGEYYSSFLHHRTPVLSNLSIQYGAFSLWQRRWLQGPELDRQLSYWESQLRELGRTELPVDRARGTSPGGAGGQTRVFVGKELTETLTRIARTHDITLFMLFLSAMEILLWRYTGEREVSVGTIIANRNRREIEGLIGCFVNTLVIRGDLRNDPTLDELFKRVRETVLDAYAHQDLPFEKLVEKLQPERDLSRSPLFGVLLIMQNAPVGEISLEGLDTAIEEAGLETARFDISVTVQETGDDLDVVIGYNSSLFHAETIDRIARHYQTLLQQFAAGGQLRLSELEMGGREDRIRGSRLEQPARLTAHEEMTVVELFERRAADLPEAIAVICGEERLSYGELNNAANRLARFLIDRGARPETCVGLHLERSIDEMIGILGIMKTGAAYVPLDWDSPDLRMQSMVETAGIGIVVTLSGRESAFRSYEGLRVVTLDGARRDIDAYEDGNPRLAIHPESLAYVIFTSGSTGQPKGVMIEQRSLSNYLRWFNDEVACLVGCVPVVSRSSFDGSLKQLLGPLLAGQPVRMIPDISRDPGQLLRAVEEGEVTALNCVPALWSALLDATESGGIPWGGWLHLEYLLLGGEALSKSLLDRTLSVNPKVRIVNLYGPTETTVNATCLLEVSPDDIHLGTPVANTQVYVLNEHLQPMPLGSIGDLYVGGIGIARGYAQRPDLTAERFLPNPFAERPGERLYKTGDLARLRADGALEYLGRADRQVKIRGYRIEPGEVEIVIRQYEQVKDCAVVTRSLYGTNSLAAYIVWQDAAEGSIESLREYVRARLPAYMQPVAWLELASFPLTGSGKLDVNALPFHEGINPGLEAVFAPPRNRIEELIATVWAEVLGVPEVGVNHNFFSDLGGHSLLAIQVVARMRDVLQIDIPLRLLFDCPSVSLVFDSLWRNDETRQHLEAVSQVYADALALSDQEIDELLEGNSSPGR